MRKPPCAFRRPSRYGAGAGARPSPGASGRQQGAHHGGSVGLRGIWGRRVDSPSELPARVDPSVSTRPAPDRFSAAGEYSRHRQKALAVLARRFPRLQEDERLDIYHAVWASVLEKRRKGERIENLEAYLMGGIDKRALKRLGRADARRRVSLDPLGDEMTRMPDDDPSPEERVVLMDELRCAREIVDDLDGREREVIKLRFDLGL